VSVNLPLADPQFWIVTGGAALALVYAVRRIRRRTRAESETPCERCPKPGNPLSPGAGAAKGPRRLGVFVAAALAGAAAVAAASIERQVAAMGTTLRVQVRHDGDRAEALGIAEAMIREVEAAEARLSTWIESSELARLNRTPVGVWIESAATPELAAAARCARETNFAFHPSIGRLVATWDLRGGGRLPGPAALAAARGGLDRVGFASDRGAARVRRTADVLLEEGGFGKGAGLDAAFETLQKLPLKGRMGGLRLDLGGQVAWLDAEEPPALAIADPRDRTRAALELAVDARRASLASSGNSEKQLTFDGESFGHLIDPRTGAPARDFGSVSVVSSSALRADCLSTALFVMGPDEGARWLAEHAGEIEAAYLVVDGGRLRARLTPKLARRARPLVADLEIEVLNDSS
jgi:FAD:protein FMN transferase